MSAALDLRNFAFDESLVRVGTPRNRPRIVYGLMLNTSVGLF